MKTCSYSRTMAKLTNQRRKWKATGSNQKQHHWQSQYRTTLASTNSTATNHCRSISSTCTPKIVPILFGYLSKDNHKLSTLCLSMLKLRITCFIAISNPSNNPKRFNLKRDIKISRLRKVTNNKAKIFSNFYHSSILTTKKQSSRKRSSSIVPDSFGKLCWSMMIKLLNRSHKWLVRSNYPLSLMKSCLRFTKRTPWTRINVNITSTPWRICLLINSTTK